MSERKRPRPQGPPLVIGGVEVKPGERRQLELELARLPTLTRLDVPVVVVRGREPGPTVWVSAALHGDELNGVEIVRRALAKITPDTLRGNVIAVPIVNVFGFIHQTRTLPDGRDLNRSFPGSSRGSLAARLAHLFMNEIIAKCSHGIDLHTAGQNRANLPQVRADLSDPETLAFAGAFGAPLMLDSRNRDGSLREAATRRGIKVLLYEAGEPLRFDEPAIEVGTAGVLQALAHLDMLPGRKESRQTPALMRSSQWVRARSGGLVRWAVDLGDEVEKDQILGRISDALGEDSRVVRAPWRGVVIGIARNPVVYQGDGVVHLGSRLGKGERDGDA